MPTPATPKRLQVIERFVTALKRITSGSVYFYTPASVRKTFEHYLKVNQFPAYFVSADTVERAPEELGDHLFREHMRVSVKCYVHGKREDEATQLEKCLHDVRTAIDADHCSSEAGSLGALCTLINVDTVEFDNGLLSLEGYGYFDQGFICFIEGDYDEL